MVKAEFWATQKYNTQLRTQLMLASANHEIQEDVVLKRLVARAGHRLKVRGDSSTVARQVIIDLGYYLFCHQYNMPRAAYELLAVAQRIDAEQRTRTRIIEMTTSKK
ncbi:hypothetical protein D1831_02205 [Lactiplantibacillus garii]|uniref:Uncharacterized protein n=1 Tax=Lactiplantibacillus garii TaxID=2306423 RepID=A0A3R8J9F6_9LACO|nr:hypothetical protein [Lactiplantibacillus garii]RRK11524.1 hypothetical protein D1831_02205 [Lactiplantibacillus garii]